MILKSFYDLFRRAPGLDVSRLNLLLLLALAALLAHWTWRFAGPVPPSPASAARAEVKLDASLASLHAAHLFGASQGQAAASVEQVTSLNLKLHGVFAALGGLSAMAIVGVNGQDQAVSTGNEIVPGVVLDAVAPDHVILLNRGVRERLDLEAVGRPLTLADGDIPLSRQEIKQAMANPRTLGVQAQSGTGTQPGLLLAAVDVNGLAARLGLQSGDRLSMVNGAAVSNGQDLARQLSGALNAQRVTVVGERHGKPLILTFRLQ
jgi:general secretion pathway protein C